MLGISILTVTMMVVAFLIISLVLVLVVLIQRPQGGGLSGAFGAGGAGSGQTAFGAKTGDALTYATIGMFILYLGMAIALNFATRPEALDAPMPQAGSATVEQTGSASTTVEVDPADPAPTGDDAQSADSPEDKPAGGEPPADVEEPEPVSDGTEPPATPDDG